MTATPQTMTGVELHALAPLGAFIRYSDGKPKPPERHVKKVRAWEQTNGQGRFQKVEHRDPSRDYSRDTIMLRLIDTDAFVATFSFNAEDASLTYEVTPPKEGAILALKDYEGRPPEVGHFFADERDVYDWGDRNRYSPLEQTKYGTRYVRIEADGSHTPWTPER